ncbi:MAG: amino acid permease [Candidatus Omnitrophica bacterium]|nr:amino acid permease [Candidatus Omnitrophota bacterium]
MSQNLKRELSLIDVFCIASGAMISSGLFILPGIAFAKAGPAAIFSYMLAGILILPAVLSKAELATAMPKAGGTYFFIERSMGALPGTIGGLASWFSLSFKSAFALVGIGIFATLINPAITQVQIKFIAVAFCLFFMFLNIAGVKEVGRFQVWTVAVLICILLFYVFRGFFHVQPERFVPFMPFGAGSVLATAGLVFVSFGGLTKVCCVAEEVKNPGRNIPLGMFLALAVVVALYAATVFVTVGLLNSAQLSSSLTPISTGAGSFMGRLGIIVMAGAALLAFVSTANAGILTASRDSMAMSRDSLLPGIFHRIHKRFKTPSVSIVFTAAFMIMVILFLSLEDLVKTASALMLLLFLLVNVSLIVMRESRIQNYKPKFHCPLYPWIQIAGIAGYSFLIFMMGKKPLIITSLFVLGATVWYFIYAKKRVRRQAALVHVVERLTAKELIDATLPDELREIVIERDEIIEDRFDQLISNSQILDLRGSMTMEEFFKKASESLGQTMAVDPASVKELLEKREKESSTVLREGLAIPHIIVEGNGKFKILLARCKDGVEFPGIKTKVHVIFILAGSKDERNLHLRVLAAIAEIVQAKDFDKKWLSARNTEELRHLILLAERKRFFGK